MRTLDLKSGATRSYPAGINRSRSDAHHFMPAGAKRNEESRPFERLA